jgi:hypothetical protein
VRLLYVRDRDGPSHGVRQETSTRKPYRSRYGTVSEETFGAAFH